MQARILVVDDHPVNVMALSMLLKASGFDVRGTSEGRAALEIAAEFRPSVVLLDIGIPVMDGYEIARRLRADPGVRVITDHRGHRIRQRRSEAEVPRGRVRPPSGEAGPARGTARGHRAFGMNWFLFR